MKYFSFIVLLLTLTGCSSFTEKRTIVVVDSTDILESIEEDGPNTVDCVFDTNAYKLTTGKLLAFKKGLPFTWNNRSKEATVVLENSDTLQLHIGGCKHFSYTASYSTGAEKFHDDTYLVNTAKWIAVNFFGSGFDKEYATALSNNQFKKRPANDSLKFFFINKSDSAATNRIHEPVLIRLSKNRTNISLGAYIN